jgi:cytochrome c peroxidase
MLSSTTSRPWSWKRTLIVELGRSHVPFGTALAVSAFALAFLGSALFLGWRANSKAVETQSKAPLGLPALPYNGVNQAKAELGKKLFFDRRLSFNGTMSCAMCHIPTEAFASTQSSTSIGMEGRTLQRNAPSLLNGGYQTSLFWDGRENSLATQVWSPLLSPIEMASPSVGFAVEKIRTLGNYANLFDEAFGKNSLNMETVGEAIAEYERTLLSGNSRFDRWKYGGQPDALTPQEQKGFALFTGKAGCSSCHLVGETSALFSDMKFHATGVGYKASVFAPPQTHNVELEPGVVTVVKNESLRSVSETPHNDLGRFAITLNPRERWAYKTPSLRNVALTYPYMHDGSIRTLEDVINFYNQGGIDFGGRDPLIHPLDLTADEKASLVAFLKSLTGDQEAKLTPPTGACADLGVKLNYADRDPRCEAIR